MQISPKGHEKTWILSNNCRKIHICNGLYWKTHISSKGCRKCEFCQKKCKFRQKVTKIQILSLDWKKFQFCQRITSKMQYLSKDCVKNMNFVMEKMWSTSTDNEKKQISSKGHEKKNFIKWSWKNTYFMKGLQKEHTFDKRITEINFIKGLHKKCKIHHQDSKHKSRHRILEKKCKFCQRIKRKVWNLSKNSNIYTYRCNCQQIKRIKTMDSIFNDVNTSLSVKLSDVIITEVSEI